MRRAARPLALAARGRCTAGRRRRRSRDARELDLADAGQAGSSVRARSDRRRAAGPGHGLARAGVGRRGRRSAMPPHDASTCLSAPAGIERRAGQALLTDGPAWQRGRQHAGRRDRERRTGARPAAAGAGHVSRRVDRVARSWSVVVVGLGGGGRGGRRQGRGGRARGGGVGEAERGGRRADRRCRLVVGSPQPASRPAPSAGRRPARHAPSGRRGARRRHLGPAGS